MDSRGNILYLVVPCYNEEEGLEHAARVMREKIRQLVKEGKISPKSKVMLVNDGSRDGTWKIISGLCKEDAVFSGICLSRNYGHQSAILSGMLESAKHADMVVTIDADLQQDIEALDKFIECYRNGCEVVYGVRNNRDTDGFFKKMTATGFYKLMGLLGCNVMQNHADYRLLSKAALQALTEYREVNLFLRGLIPTMGFPSDVVYFDVKKREAGHSKYTLKKMMALAVDGQYVQFCNDYYMPGGLDDRQKCTGIYDDSCGVASDGRPDHFFPGSGGGICGENLYGDKGAPAIYY